jgi:hypothetical protein
MDDLIHSELLIVVGVEVSALDLTDAVVFRRDFDDYDAPLGDRANRVAKT